MKYNLEITFEGRPVLKAVNLLVPEPIYREFKYATKNQRLTMTQILVQAMEKFSNEYRSQGTPKQTSFL